MDYANLSEGLYYNTESHRFGVLLFGALCNSSNLETVCHRRTSAQPGCGFQMLQ